MTDDAFFGMTPAELYVVANTLTNTNYVTLSGEHDELVLNPKRTLDEFYSQLPEAA